MTTPHTETLWIAKYDPELDVNNRSCRAPRYEADTLARTRQEAWSYISGPYKASRKALHRRGWRVVKVKVEEVK